MPLLFNRVRMTTTTTGTGAITLGAAVEGFQGFDAAGVTNGDVVRYVIEDGTAWEIGEGTYTASGTVLSRTAQESSNAGAAISLSGSATVFIGATAADIREAVDAATLSQAWAESPTAPGDPGTKSAKTWAGEAEGSAAEAALYDGLSFDTIAIMADYEGFVDGNYYTVNSAFNNEPDTYHYDASSTLPEDGTLIVAPASGVGRYVSTRKTLATVSDLLTGDLRGYETYIAGDTVTADGFRYEVAAAGALDHHLTTAGGVKLYALAPYDFAQFGCTSSADSADAFSNALTASAGDPIRLLGTVRIDTAASYSGKVVNIWSPGDVGKLDLSNGGSVSFIAGLTALPDLNAAIEQYDNQVSFASAHGLSVGDVFCVWNPTEYSFNPQRPSYHDGDWIEVSEVPNVNDVVMFGTSPDLYAASDMECYKMEGEGVSITGVTVVPNPSGVHFFIQNHKSVDCRMGFERGADYAGVQILRCYNIKFDCLPMDVNQGDAYPVSIGNSKNFTVDLDRSRSTRHVAGFGGSGGPGSVPNRNGKIIGGRLINNADLGIGAADFHGNNDNLQYIGCDIYGANMGGRNSAMIDCTLWGRYPYDADDNVIYSPANCGGLTRIHDCTLKVRGTGNPYAFIHFELLNLSGDVCFDIRDLTVDHADTGVTVLQVLEFNLGTPTTISGATQANPCVISATGHGLVSGQRVKIKDVAGMTELNGNTYTATAIDANSFSLDVDATGFTPYTSGGTAAHPYRIDIVLDGLNYRGAAPARLFEISGTQDFSDQMSLQVDNIQLPRCTLVRCANTDNYDMPMRLPKSTVSADLSVTTASNYFSTNQLDYQWIYPKVPNGAVSIHPTDQAHFLQTPFPTANLRRVRAGDCHLAISSFDGANFTFAKDFRIVGEFWINDL